MSVPTGPVAGGPDPEPGFPESAATPNELQSVALRGSWWTGVQAAVGLPLGVVVNLIVARSLGPEGFGLLATYMTAFALVLVVLNGGVSDGTIQWGAAAYARGDRDALMQLCRRCAGFHLLVEAPLGGVAAVVLLRDESIAKQVVAAVVIGFTMYLGTAVVVLTAVSMNAMLARLNLVVGLAIQLAVVVAVVGSHDPGWTWVARLTVSLFVPVGGLLLAPRDIRRASLRPLLPLAWPAGFAAYSVRTLFAGLVTALVYSRSEVLVLDAFGDAAGAGLFALAAGLAVQITGVVDAMLGPLVPAAASLLAISRERAASAVLRGMRLSALATAPIALIGVPTLAVLTPRIYGDRFTTAGALFIALGVVSCVQSVLHPVTAFVAALRKPIVLLAINSVALALDLLLVVATHRAFGVAAAVIGNSVGQAVSLTACTLLLRRHLEVRPRATLAALVPFLMMSACGAVGAAAGFIAQRGGVETVAALAVALGISVAAGLAVAGLAGGLLTAGDLLALDQGLPRRVRRPLVHAVEILRLLRRDDRQDVSASPVPDQ